MRGAVVMTDRPTRLRRDDANRLHCEDGPAIEYGDGWSVYAWHGTRIPQDWIVNRKTLDPKTALTHKNVEMRRAAADIVGWEAVLEHVSARVIDVDKDPEIGTLLEVDLPDSPRSRFLRVQCGTKRVFALPVPAEMKTALQANAWTYDVDVKTILRLEART